MPATGKLKVTKLRDLVKTGAFCGNEVSLALPNAGTSVIYQPHQALCSAACADGADIWLLPDLSRVADALQTLLEQSSLTGPCVNLVLEIAPADDTAQAWPRWTYMLLQMLRCFVQQLCPDDT